MRDSTVRIDETCTGEYYHLTEKRELWDHVEHHTFDSLPGCSMAIRRTYRSSDRGITPLSFERIIEDPVSLDGMRVVGCSGAELDGWAIVRALGMV